MTRAPRRRTGAQALPTFVVVLLALLLLPVPITAQGDADETGDDGETTSGTTIAPAPEDWAPWYDETLKVRVPLSLSLTGAYPSTWSGERVVAHALDVTEVLQRGNWPLDAVTDQPLRFTVDMDSIRVVPADGEAEPLSHLAWDGAPFEPPGTVEAGHDVVTVAFAAERGVDDYFIYFDREEDGTDDPLPRDPVREHQILQALAGPGAGHRNIGIAQGAVRLAIGSGYTGSVEAQQLTPEGWAPIACTSGSVSPSQWVTCSLNTGEQAQPVRVEASTPVAVYAWPGPAYASSGGEPDKRKVIPLSGIHGHSADRTLLAPAPTGSTSIYVVALEPCPGGCSVTPTPGGAPSALSVGIPREIPLSQPALLEANGPIIGWLQGSGRGPANLPVGITPNATFAGMTSPEVMDRFEPRLSATGDDGARILLTDEDGSVSAERRFAQGQPVNPAHDLTATTWTQVADFQGRGFMLQAENTLYWPQLLEADVQGSTDVPDQVSGITQLGPTPVGATGWIGEDPSPHSRSEASRESVRLISLPFQGEDSLRIALSTQEQAGIIVEDGKGGSASPLATEALRYSEDGNSKESGTIDIDGALAEVFAAGTTGPLAAFAIYGDLDDSKPGNVRDAVSGLFAGQLEGVPAEEGAPDILGALFQLAIEPPDVFARPGETVTLSLMGTGFIQRVDGSRAELSLSFSTNTSGGPPGLPPDLLLASSSATLDPSELTKVTDLQVKLPAQYPPDALPTTYAVAVTGDPEGVEGDDVTTRSTLTVRVKRDVSLTFEDGTHETALETEDGRATTPLILRNLGTGPQAVTLTISMPPVQGWSVEVTERGAPVSSLTLPPGGQARLELAIDAPEGTAVVLPVTVSAQGTQDASVSDSVTAQVVHNVELDVDARILPDLVSLPRGATATANLVLANRGSPVNVRISPLETEGLQLEAARSSVNLGEEGTGVENATIPINLTVAPDAPLGAVLVGTVEALYGRGQDLEPTRQLLSLRARVVPVHDLSVVDRIDALPGLEQPVRVDVLNEGDVDERLELTVLRAPLNWQVDLPDVLEAPQNTTTPLRFNLTLPPGIPAGSESIRLLADPASAGEDLTITIPVRVLDGPAFQFELPDQLEMGLGERRTLEIDVENRGNAAGEAGLALDGPGVESTAIPEAITLGPGDTDTISLRLAATELGNHTLVGTIDPSPAHELTVRVGQVAFELDVVSTDPAPPRPGEPFKALVSVTNTGDAPARDVSLVLTSDEGPLVNETIGMLAPGRSATITLATQSLPTLDGLQVLVDPEGRYENAGATTTGLPGAGADAPLPWSLSLVALLAAWGVLWRRRNL